MMAGISIKVNDQFIVLDESANISIEQNNGIVDQTVIPGDYTFPFSLPFHPINDQVFNLPRVINNTAVFEQDYQATVYLAGNIYSTGIINITRKEDNNYSAVYKSEVARLKSNIENKKLPEFDYGGVRTIGTDTASIIAHAKTVSSAAPLVYDYAFPSVYNPGLFESGDWTAERKIINEFNAITEEYEVNDIHENPNPDNTHVLIPMPYLHYVLKQIFAAAGYLLDGDFMQDEEMKQLVVYNNFMLDKKAVKYYTKALLSASFNDDTATVIFDNDSTGGASDDDSAYDTTNGRYTIQKKGYHRFTFNLKYETIPAGSPIFMQARIKLDGTTDIAYAEEYNVTDMTLTVDIYVAPIYVGHYITAHFRSRDPLGGADPVVKINTGTSFECQNISQNELNIYSETLDIANHVPDMLATDLLTSLLSIGVRLSFNKSGTTAYLNYAKTPINSSQYVDYTAKARAGYLIERSKNQGYTFDFEWPDDDAMTEGNFVPQTGKEVTATVDARQDLPSEVPNTICYINNINKIVAAVYDDDFQQYNWTDSSDNNFPLVVSGGKQNITAQLAPTFMRRVTATGGSIILPSLSQKGVSLFENITGSKISSLRLFFYRGMINNSAGNPYPFGSTTVYDDAGNKIANYALAWDGDYGIYNTLIKKYIQFISQAKLATYKVDLSAAELNELRMDKKVMIDRIQYVINRIRLSATPSKITELTMELYTV